MANRAYGYTHNARMFRSGISYAGHKCPCCEPSDSTHQTTRTREKRAWKREIAAELSS